MVALAPLVPLAGKAALALGKGGLTRAATRSLVSGAAFQAGAELVSQIAEWARSIGGEFDTTDPGSGGDNCQEMNDGGYGQFQYRIPGSGWFGPTDEWIYSSAVRIVPFPAYQSSNEKWIRNCEVYSANDGTTESIGGFDTEADANAVEFRILPTEGDCKDSSGGGGHDWDTPLPLPPMQSGDCEINVSFHGFMAAEDGTGTVRPVFEFTPALPEGRAGGGVITGDCNFQPTISVGGGGDGSEPPIFLPNPYGDDGPYPPRGEEWWKTLAKGAVAGAVGALVNQLINGLLTEQAPGAFTLQAPCDVDEEGNPLTASWAFPAQPAQARILSHQGALMEIMQQHLNWKTPTCGNEKPPLEGQWVTTRWLSDEKMDHSGVRLRKLFRYRTKSTRNLGQLSAYWEAFTWEAGPIRVHHKGAWWGTPAVWASSSEEGKRVIRFAAAEAGIDPDQIGEWGVSSSRSPRYGMSSTMTIHLKDGYPWISAREGDSWPNTLARAHDSYES